MSLELERDRPGRHFGRLAIAHSHDGSAYGQVVVPLVALVGGAGPTVLLSAGVHGDEGEGPLALLALAHALDPAALCGRVILAPAMNPLALAAGRRTSPDDRGNLARLFPGDASGSITERLAAAIGASLLPLADAVLDLHAGGRTLEFAPSALVRVPRDAALAARVRALALGLGLPRAVFVPAPAEGGTLVAAALARGIPALATEIGGAGGVSAHSVAATEAAVRRLLAMLGVLTGAPDAPVPSRAMVQAGILRAPGAGLFRPGFMLGDIVAIGAAAGTLHDPMRPDRPGETLCFPAAGEIVARGVGTMLAAGDALAVLATAE